MQGELSSKKQKQKSILAYHGLCWSTKATPKKIIRRIPSRNLVNIWI